jgi:hypothetical protein
VLESCATSTVLQVVRFYMCTATGITGASYQFCSSVL